MILWTIQPEEVFNLIQTTGVYRCDLEQSFMKDYAEPQYHWLVSQMRKRIGQPPEGVTYPVWAWYKWRVDRRKPDLRTERWYCGSKGDKFFRLEIEIPDNQVLLSDFDGWAGIILNDGLLSYSEEESEEIEKLYNSLTPEGQKEMRSKNWEKVFDITPYSSEWMCRGESIQATFWELRKEQIRKATMFMTMGRRWTE